MLDVMIVVNVREIGLIYVNKAWYEPTATPEVKRYHVCIAHSDVETSTFLDLMAGFNLSRGTVSDQPLAQGKGRSLLPKLWYRPQGFRTHDRPKKV